MIVIIFFQNYSIHIEQTLSTNRCRILIPNPDLEFNRFNKEQKINKVLKIIKYNKCEQGLILIDMENIFGNSVTFKYIKALTLFLRMR